jgi:hypothetical protein
MTTLLQRTPGIEVAPEAFDLARFNGHVTLKSPKTGRELTFLIQTCTKGSWRGRRLVTLKNKQADGMTAKTCFGELTDFSIIRVFRKLRGQDRPFEKYADLLNRAAYWAGRGVGYRIEVRCRRCNRLLTVESSRADGLGPDCRKKLAS